jgi:hypothetical protein
VSPVLPREERAAEVLAAHQRDTEARGITPGGNPTCTCGRWYGHGLAAHQAAMLAAAGLLADPTARTEWGVACDIHDEVSEADDREDAERIKAHHDAGMDHGHTLVRRTVTDWTPAEEGEHG